MKDTLNLKKTENLNECMRKEIWTINKKLNPIKKRNKTMS